MSHKLKRVTTSPSGNEIRVEFESGTEITTRIDSQDPMTLVRALETINNLIKQMVRNSEHEFTPIGRVYKMDRECKLPGDFEIKINKG